MAHDLVCWKCGASLAALSLPLSRRDECPRCRAELHVCKMCIEYDETLAKRCREPTAEEVANRVDFTIERVREIQRINQDTVSLEQPMGDEDDFSLSDLIEDREAVVPDDAAARMMLDDAVREALGHLSPREQDVVRLRFGLEDGKIRTLEEVGKAFGVTRERIRQIEAKTLAKLRRPESAQLLRDYLDEA